MMDRNGSAFSVTSPLQQCDGQGEVACQWTQGKVVVSSSLAAEAREQIAQEWATAAMGEHASVASFARFSLHLMALGAPPQLLRAAHLSAAQEVTHAQLCLALAASYSAQHHKVQPGPFPLPSASDEEQHITLGTLAEQTASEGCVHETIAAVTASVRAAVLQWHMQGFDDPVRASVLHTLRTIAKDEAEHAALAWGTVRWAANASDDEANEAVRARVVRALQVGMRSGLSRKKVEAPGHGWLQREQLEKIHRVMNSNVVAPWANAIALGMVPEAPDADRVRVAWFGEAGVTEADEVHVEALIAALRVVYAAAFM